MSVSSIGGAASLAMTRATERIAATAENVARGPQAASPEAIPAALVAAQVQMAAAATVMRTINETTGTIVNMLI